MGNPFSVGIRKDDSILKQTWDNSENSNEKTKILSPKQHLSQLISDPLGIVTQSSPKTNAWVWYNIRYIATNNIKYNRLFQNQQKPEGYSEWDSLASFNKHPG